jgi:hypothetical protein
MSVLGDLASLGRAIDPSYYARESQRSGNEGAGAGVSSGPVPDAYRFVSIADRIKKIYENWQKIGVPLGEGRDYRSVPIDRLSDQIQSRILTSAAQALLAHASPLGAIAAELLVE